MDAVFYLLYAMRLFRGKSLLEITFEISMLGQHGLDINDAQESHVLRKLPESLAGVLACYELSALLQKLISGKVREVCCRAIWRESG